MAAVIVRASAALPLAFTPPDHKSPEYTNERRRRH